MQEELVIILEALEAETNLEIKAKLVMGIKTLLDIMSIALQYKREKDQKSLSKQKASTIPLFILNRPL